MCHYLRSSNNNCQIIGTIISSAKPTRICGGGSTITPWQQGSSNSRVRPPSSPPATKVAKTRHPHSDVQINTVKGCVSTVSSHATFYHVHLDCIVLTDMRASVPSHSHPHRPFRTLRLASTRAAGRRAFVVRGDKTDIRILLLSDGEGLYDRRERSRLLRGPGSIQSSFPPSPLP